MNPSVDDSQSLRRILANIDALLLDFDGPICSVFAGISARVVADQLRQVLAEGGHAVLPDDVRTADDPFDVLFYAAKLGQDEARYVEAAFRAHEVEAVQSAEPTQGSTELIRAWRETGRAVAVVSNNSVAAVETYLDIHHLRAEVDHVSARASANVALLKPSPALVVEATDVLGVPPHRCVLLGDSVADMHASQAAQTVGIGYANKPHKTQLLTFNGAVAIATNTGALLAAL